MGRKMKDSSGCNSVDNCPKKPQQPSMPLHKFSPLVLDSGQPQSGWCLAWKEISSSCPAMFLWQLEFTKQTP